MLGSHGHAIEAGLDKEGVLGSLSKVDPSSSLLGVGVVGVRSWGQMIKGKGDSLYLDI